MYSMPRPCFVVSNPLPTFRSRKCSRLPRRISFKALQAGVVGASGGLGRVMVQHLLESTRCTSSPITTVSAFVRDPLKAEISLPSSDPALRITKLPPSEEARILQDAFRGISYMIICVGTTAFPTKSWRNGNTPFAIDDVAASRWVAELDQQSIRRIIYISSIGVERKSSFSLFILNSFGVLDAMRREPNPRKPKLLLKLGDCVSGEVSRSASAEIAVISTIWEDCCAERLLAVRRRGTYNSECIHL